MAQPSPVSADAPATLGDLNAAVQALADHFDGKLASLETRLSRQIDALSGRVGGLEERVAGLEEKFDAHARETRLLLLVIVEKLFTPEELEGAMARLAPPGQ